MKSLAGRINMEPATVFALSTCPPAPLFVEKNNQKKLRNAVMHLDQAFKMSYGLSYEKKAVAAAAMQVSDFRW